MSKLGKKVSRKLDEAADTVIRAGYDRGPKSLAAANIASAVLLGRYWVRCSDGKACTNSRHQHVDLD